MARCHPQCIERVGFGLEVRAFPRWVGCPDGADIDQLGQAVKLVANGAIVPDLDWRRDAQFAHESHPHADHRPIAEVAGHNDAVAGQRRGRLRRGEQIMQLGQFVPQVASPSNGRRKSGLPSVLTSRP